MKKISIFIFLLFTLQWCFLGDWENTTGLVIQENESFSISIPESWVEIDKSDIPQAKSWEIELAYSSTSERQWYLNNLIILNAGENSTSTAVALIKDSLQALQKSVQNFQLIEEKTFIFPDEGTGMILTYTAQYNEATPQSIYIQTARVCADTSYYITLSLAEQLESYERYRYILETFTCK